MAAISPIAVTVGSNGGCLLDLSLIVDAKICPTIDVLVPKPHTATGNSPDTHHIVITPTAPEHKDYYVHQRDYKTPEWCGKKDIEIDLFALVELNLLSLVDLDLHLHLAAIVKALVKLDPTVLANLKVDVAALVKLGVDADIQVKADLLAKIKALVDIDIDIDLCIQVLNLLHIKADVNADVTVSKRSPLLDANVDVDAKLSLLGLVNADIKADIDVLIGKNKVHHMKKHYAPTCGKKLNPATPGCHTTTAPNAADCFARCHKRAIQLQAEAVVGDLAKVVDCTGISFDPTLVVDNCLFATVPLLGLDAFVDAHVEVEGIRLLA